MATITPKPLVQGVLLPASAAATPGQYAVPAATTATVRSLTLCNTGAVTRLVSVHIVASGGSASDANKILKAVSLVAGETLIDDSLRNLAAGDFITGFADAATTVSMRVDGAEIT